MKKTEKNIREQFRITDRNIVIDEKRKEETMSFLQKEISRKKTGVRPDRKKILIRQFRYMDKTMLAIHGIFCMIALFVVVTVPEYWGHGIKKEEDIILVSTVISGFLGLFSVLAVGRIFFSGLTELSESCYFNVRQMVAFQMFLSGMISLSVLSVNILFVGMRWKIDLLRAGLYLFVPFVMTECCCLMAVLSETGRKNIYLLTGVGTFSVVSNVLLASSPQLYRMSALTFWGIAFAGGLLLLTVQIGILFRGIEKGEILCTN